MKKSWPYEGTTYKNRAMYSSSIGKCLGFTWYWDSSYGCNIPDIFSMHHIICILYIHKLINYNNAPCQLSCSDISIYIYEVLSCQGWHKDVMFSFTFVIHGRLSYCKQCMHAFNFAFVWHIILNINVVKP